MVFLLAGRYYAGFIHRNLASDDSRPTPAVVKEDGRDYVPSPTQVVFAHHFAAIAGAGPIVGPLFAIVYGWGPAWLWVLLGCVFFGAVHDYTALYVAMREGGQSLAVVARNLFGKAVFTLFIAFTIIMLLLVTATFLNLSATALVSRLPAKDIGLSDHQTLLKTVTTPDGRILAQVGGIASSSVIVITIFAPLVGFLYLKKKVNIWVCSGLALLICAFSIYAGFLFPVMLGGPASWIASVLPASMAGAVTAENLWKLLLAAYTMIAAGIPVWLLLQSRDFINVHILYAGIVLLVVGVVIGGLTGMSMNLPMTNVAEGTAKIGFMWPALFITIACGAISGFHSLCAGGTTCKQLGSESSVRTVGYYAMLLEGLVAVLVICVVCMGHDKASYMSYAFPAAGASNPVLAFGVAVGRVMNAGLSWLPPAVGAVFAMLILEGFIITTLDAAVRFNRYLFEELWATLFQEPPKILKHYWTNSGLAVVLMLLFAFNNSVLSLWTLFASSNQLLAALVLGVVTFWMVKHGLKYFYTLIPAVVMLATTVTMLVLELNRFLHMPGRVPPAPVPWDLVVADVAIIGITVGLVAMSLKGIAEIVRGRREVARAAR